MLLFLLIFLKTVIFVKPQDYKYKNQWKSTPSVYDDSGFNRKYFTDQIVDFSYSLGDGLIVEIKKCCVIETLNQHDVWNYNAILYKQIKFIMSRIDGVDCIQKMKEIESFFIMVDKNITGGGQGEEEEEKYSMITYNNQICMGYTCILHLNFQLWVGNGNGVDKGPIGYLPYQVNIEQHIVNDDAQNQRRISTTINYERNSAWIQLTQVDFQIYNGNLFTKQNIGQLWVYLKQAPKQLLTCFEININQLKNLNVQFTQLLDFYIETMNPYFNKTYYLQTITSTNYNDPPVINKGWCWGWNLFMDSIQAAVFNGGWVDQNIKNTIFQGRFGDGSKIRVVQ